MTQDSRTTLAQQVIHRAGSGIVIGLSRQAENVLNGTQHREVSIGYSRSHAASLGSRTCKDSQDLVALAAVIFIPGQDQQALIHRAGR